MADPIKQTCLCPKCGRKLAQSGKLIIAGELEIPTFQCDECLMNVDFGGELMEIALTFARRADGTLFDPADPERPLTFDQPPA